MKKSYGQSLVELILIIAVSAIILPALLTGLITSRSGKAQQDQRLKASFYLREMQEAVRSIREDGWDNFDEPGIYHPEVSSGRWILSENSETVSEEDGMVRRIEITNVFRDDQGDITFSDGTIDPSTKRFIFRVLWESPYASSTESTMYLARLANETYTETTEEDFSAGITTGTAIQNVYGGEVMLGGGGGGDWCQPNLSISGLDLPKSGVANAISAVEGRAYVGTGNNAAGETFVVVSISQDDPPSAEIEGRYLPPSTPIKTNDIYGEDNYIYLATDTNDSEILILDISQTPYQQIGKFNAEGPQDGISVLTSGNYGFMTQGNSKFRIFDISGKSGDRNEIANLDLSGNGNDIFIVGDYAYVAVDSTSIQMQIIDISNPASPSIVSGIKVANRSGRAVYVNNTATRAYLATALNSASSDPQDKEMHIINISDKQNPVVVSSYDSGSMDPKDITVVTNNKAIIVGISGEEYQVIDFTNEQNPIKCGGLEVNSGINAIDSVLEEDGDVFSYILTKDANAEFRIIEGGPGNFSTYGTYESAIFEPDPVNNTTFNRFSATISQPDQTSISTQVAVAEAVSDSCGNVEFVFVGPDRTTETFFTSEDGQVIEGPIPFGGNDQGYQNPGRCFKYKVYFSTDDVSQTPVLYDMTINYAP